jgi:excisionase family DNA binding protein
MNEAPTPAWTVRQVAEYLSVNERTVYRTAERGEIPAFKVGDAWRVRPEDIDA